MMHPNERHVYHFLLERPQTSMKLEVSQVFKLTVLFAQDWPDEEDEVDEELGEWNPTFHKSRRR